MGHAVFFMSSAEGEPRRDCWAPPVDVLQTREGWLLRYELAGVRLQDVSLQLSRRQISLSGLRRDSMRLEEGCRFYSMEISYSRFERVIEVPTDLDGARVMLDYQDGILLVRIQLAGENERNTR